MSFLQSREQREIQQSFRRFFRCAAKVPIRTIRRLLETKLFLTDQFSVHFISDRDFQVTQLLIFQISFSNEMTFFAIFHEFSYSCFHFFLFAAITTCLVDKFLSTIVTEKLISFPIFQCWRLAKCIHCIHAAI